MANGTGPQVEVPGSEMNSTVIPMIEFYPSKSTLLHWFPNSRYQHKKGYFTFNICDITDSRIICKDGAFVSAEGTDKS